MRPSCNHRSQGLMHDVCWILFIYAFSCIDSHSPRQLAMNLEASSGEMLRGSLQKICPSSTSLLLLENSFFQLGS